MLCAPGLEFGDLGHTHFHSQHQLRRQAVKATFAVHLSGAFGAAAKTQMSFDRFWAFSGRNPSFFCISNLCNTLIGR